MVEADWKIDPLSYIEEELSYLKENVTRFAEFGVVAIVTLALIGLTNSKKALNAAK